MKAQNELLHNAKMKCQKKSTKTRPFTVLYLT
jgi:hypothetical protein